MSARVFFVYIVTSCVPRLASSAYPGQVLMLEEFEGMKHSLTMLDTEAQPVKLRPYIFMSYIGVCPRVRKERLAEMLAAMVEAYNTTHDNEPETP